MFTVIALGMALAGIACFVGGHVCLLLAFVLAQPDMKMQAYAQSIALFLAMFGWWILALGLLAFDRIPIFLTPP